MKANIKFGTTSGIFHGLHRRWFLVSLLLATVLAGCSQNLPGMGAIQQRACEPLTNLDTTIDQFAGISADVTVGDVRQIKAEVDGVVSLLRTANQALNATAVEDLLTSYDGLAATIEGLPDDQPIGDSLAEIQTAVQQVQATLDQAIAGLNCGQ